jgi:flagellar export protein FliJ
VGFRFRLAPVLRHRERVEDERELALADAVRHHAATAGRLADREQERVSAGRALLAAGLRGTTGGELGTLAAHVALARARVAGAAREVAAAATAFDVARAALVQSARERRTLERLEELQRAAHEAREAGSLRRDLDDIGSVYHVHRGAARAGGGSA